MRKTSYVLARRSGDWPPADMLGKYYSELIRQSRFFDARNDCGVFSGEGLYGTESLEQKTGRVDVDLYFNVHPEHGIFFQYTKWDGRVKQLHVFCAKGNLARRKEFVNTFAGSLRSVGLFVPLENGIAALAEFIGTGGELPPSIEWVAADELPPDTFPIP